MPPNETILPENVLLGQAPQVARAKGIHSDHFRWTILELARFAERDFAIVVEHRFDWGLYVAHQELHDAPDLCVCWSGTIALVPCDSAA